MSHEAHENAAKERTASVRCGILTCSDTRSEREDVGGDRVQQALVEAGHEVVGRRLSREDPALLGGALDALLAEDLELVVTTGGTGIARRDVTIEVVRARLDLELDGFGELFRALSHEEIGPAAMLSRATGGVVRSDRGDRLLFALPGSVGAVALAMSRLIVPQLPHMRHLLDRT